MGPRWINAADDWGRRRIDDPEDWVRIELATALQRGIPVIPLMLDGFQAPPPEALNDALSGLAFQQSHPLQNASWMSDVQHLIDLLAARLALPRRDRESTPGTLSKPRKTIRRTALSDEEVLARLNNEGLAHWRSRRGRWRPGSRRTIPAGKTSGKRCRCGSRPGMRGAGSRTWISRPRQRWTGFTGTICAAACPARISGRWPMDGQIERSVRRDAREIPYGPSSNE